MEMAWHWTNLGGYAVMPKGFAMEVAPPSDVCNMVSFSHLEREGGVCGRSWEYQRVLFIGESKISPRVCVKGLQHRACCGKHDVC